MRPSYLEPLSRQLLSWPSATKEKGPEEGEGGDENEAASGAQAHIPCAPFATSLSFVLSLRSSRPPPRNPCRLLFVLAVAVVSTGKVDITRGPPSRVRTLADPLPRERPI